MNNHHTFKILRLFLLIIMVSFFIATPALAAVVGFVAEGSDGKYYEYNYDELLESYVLHIMGVSAPIYADYIKNNVRVLLDDKRGYIDYENVLEAYVTALISGNTFNLHQYTSSSSAKKATMPTEINVVSLGTDGKLKFTKKILDQISDLLEAINDANNVNVLETLLISNAGELGLNLSSLNSLNTYSKTAALSEILANRPGSGFTSTAQVKNTFNNAVTAATSAFNAALKSINDATSQSVMRQAINNNSAILELNISRYSLTSTQQNTLSSRLLQLKPFASANELIYILHTGVMEIRSGFTFNYTPYNYTLTHMVNTQMGLSAKPQTDLYGGGWQNAKREDVEYYVNPFTFIDLDYDGSLLNSVRINTASLRLRERPTTQSPQLKDEAGREIFVTLNQVYPILGEAQAEPGTASGTEGPWYKIRVSNREGWVCGQYVVVLQGSFSATPMFQFLRLSGSAGSTVADLNKILNNKGILHGTGAVFMEGSNNNNINEIFLVSLGLHESGNGTSRLATGIEVEDKDNLFPGEDFVVVYNMFGIGAFDSNPNLHGSQFAYNQRWFTPEDAIRGGAKFASERYVNNPSYYQNTLYKMRWNPSTPGVHQYATDIGWAAKQVFGIRNLYNQIENYTLVFDIPRFKE